LFFKLIYILKKLKLKKIQNLEKICSNLKKQILPSFLSNNNVEPMVARVDGFYSNQFVRFSLTFIERLLPIQKRPNKVKVFSLLSNSIFRH
jgi:hypothetical protein